MKKIILTLCAIMFASVMVQAQETTPKDTEANKAHMEKKMELAKKAEADKTAATLLAAEKKGDPNNPPSNNEAEKKKLTELSKQAAVDYDNRTQAEIEKDAKAERAKAAKTKIDN